MEIMIFTAHFSSVSALLVPIGVEASNVRAKGQVNQLGQQLLNPLLS